MRNSDTNNIFDPHPAASPSDPHGPFEPSSPVVAGLFEESTPDDHGPLAPHDAGFEERYQAVLADELESDDRGHEGRRSFAFALPSGGLARQLVVGAICAIAAFLVASIAISLFHGSHHDVKSTPTAIVPPTIRVSGHTKPKVGSNRRAARARAHRRISDHGRAAHARAHREVGHQHRTARRHAPRVHKATPRATTRRPVERHVAQRRANVSAPPAAPPVPAAVEPPPAPQQVSVPPSYTPPVYAPAPQSPPNSEFGFER